MRAQHATAWHIGYAQASSAATIVVEVGDGSVVGRDSRHRLAAQTAGNERARRDALSGDRRRDRTFPALVEWHAGEPQRPTHAKGDELTGCALVEPGNYGIAAVLGQIFPKAASVGVWRETVGPAREQQGIPRRSRLANPGIRADRLAMITPLRAPARGEP